MTRRLVAFALVVCAAAVLALVVPLAVAARDSARTQALAAAQTRAQATAELVAAAAPGDLRPVLAAAPPGPGELSVVAPDGAVVGATDADAAAEADAGAEPAVGAARAGRAVSVADGGDVVVASPAVGPAGTSVVLVRLTPADLRDGLGGSVLVLVGSGLVLLVAAGVSALVLARRTAAPIHDVSEVADRIADGDLTARAPASGLPEVAAVATALNRLAGRVQDLLAQERRDAGDLAHRLRTPLTALAVDLDAVQDPEVRERLREDLPSVQGGVDEVIETVRRPQREGLLARCDAVEVVAARVDFWRVLADDQGRTLTATLPPAPALVRLAREDLETVVDIALQNVFLHTDEGTALAVELVAHRQGGARLAVDDAGPGWGASSAPTVGSTGLGLDIAARTAEASGGGLRRERSALGGARLVVELGAPAA